MICNKISIVILQSSNSIPSVRNSGHSMKILSAFIPQFNSVCCKSFLSIYVFISWQSLQMILDDSSAIPLWDKKRPAIFHCIQEEDDFIAHADQLRKIGQPFALMFQTISCIFEFASQDRSCISVISNLFTPTFMHCLKETRMLGQKNFKSKEISLRNISANNNLTGDVV